MSLERWLYAWRARLRALFDRDGANRELHEELQYHVDREIEARCANGVPPAEARRQALAALGGLAQTSEHVRASRFGASLEEGFRDIRHGLRLLIRHPGFTAATVLTLTLAIGATTAIFSIVDAVLLQPPPFPQPDRLVTLWQTDPDNGNHPADVAPANFLDWRDRAGRFERVAAIEPWSLDFTGAGDPEVFYGSLVTEGFFEILGAGATLGRTFLSQEYRPGSGVIVLTHGLWQRRFGGETDVIGRSLVLDGAPYTVIGVLAPHFELGIERGRGERDFFLPRPIAEWETSSRGNGWWHVIGRLLPEVTLAEAQAEMDAVAARLAAEYPRTNTDVGARVIPLQARQVEAVQPTLLLLQGAVLFVLLIACVNVANLMLARCTRRAPEFAVRMAVGGGHGRLLRQLLTESAVIAGLGGFGGLVFATLSLDAITAFMPADVPRLAQVTLNARLLGFAVGLVGMTTLACGMAPAAQVVRQNVHELLRGQRSGTSTVQQRLRRALVTAEVALALVLLVGAGLLLQSFVRLVHVDLGFAPENTVTLQVFVPHAQAPDGSMTYVVRTAGDPTASVPAIQDVVWNADPLQTFYGVATVDQLLSDTLAARRFTTTLLALFGLAALVLAGLGIYGVIAVATAQRTREIGLRLAMGAAPRHVVGMVVRGAIGLAGAGILFGVLASLLVSRSLSSLLVDVAPFDAPTLAAVSVLLLLVAAGAAWLPARRAARVDPLVALRTE